MPRIAKKTSTTRRKRCKVCGCLPRRTTHIKGTPRKLSAYQRYVQYLMQTGAIQQLKKEDRMRQCGAQWRTLPEEKRTHFQDLANNEYAKQIATNEDTTEESQ